MLCDRERFARQYFNMLNIQHVEYFFLNDFCFIVLFSNCMKAIDVLRTIFLHFLRITHNGSPILSHPVVRAYDIREEELYTE